MRVANVAKADVEQVRVGADLQPEGTQSHWAPRLICTSSRKHPSTRTFDALEDFAIGTGQPGPRSSLAIAQEQTTLTVVRTSEASAPRYFGTP